MAQIIFSLFAISHIKWWVLQYILGGINNFYIIPRNKPNIEISHFKKIY